MDNKEPRTVFGSASEGAAAPTRRLPKLTRRRLLLVVGLLVVVALAAAGIWWWQASQVKPVDQPHVAAYVAPKIVCTDADIDIASQAIRDSNTTQLGTLTAELLSRADHYSDINCGYIITRYYMTTGRISEAQTALRHTRARSDNGQSISTRFDPPALSLDTLSQAIESMDKNRSATSGPSLSLPAQGDTQ